MTRDVYFARVTSKLSADRENFEEVALRGVARLHSAGRGRRVVRPYRRR